MAKHVLLNNIQHKDLRVITRFSADYGDNIGSTLTFPTEFADVQKEYPIFFQINQETGKYQSIVLFGLSQDENLFLKDDGIWDAAYIPAVMARGPFLIGFQQDPNNPDSREPVIHVDMESPRVSTSEGVPVFLEFGGNSSYLENITRSLKDIYDGMAISEVMFQAFTELNLIEPVNIEIELNNSTQYRLNGNYTINRDKLANLTGDELLRLNQSGFLAAAFLVVASLGNMQKLINIKNRKN
jgi:SapC